MAVGRPWYKRRGGDFVTGTLHMPPIERLCYSLIIDMLNDRDRPLPDDPGFIAGFCGISKQKWARARHYLIAGGYLFETGDGRLSNPTFAREHVEREHEKEMAVEHGRAGGRKSAEMRARGQGELDLAEGQESPPPYARARTEDGESHEKLEKTSQVSSNKVATNRVGSSEMSDLETPQINDLAEPPPQAPCAREEVRGKNREDSSHPDSVAVTRDGALNDADLMAKFEAVSEAAGFRPVDPGAISRGVKAVQDWVAAGYDFDEVVLPTIRKSVAEDLHGRGHTRTLGRFRQAIAGEHARSAARKGLGKRPDPPASPILDPKGEDPMFKPLRQALLERWGPHAYCVAANDVRFEAVDDAMNGSRPLRVIADERSNSSPRIKNGEYVATLRAVAKAHGFDAVW